MSGTNLTSNDAITPQMTCKLKDLNKAASKSDRKNQAKSYVHLISPDSLTAKDFKKNNDSSIPFELLKRIKQQQDRVVVHSLIVDKLARSGIKSHPNVKGESTSAYTYTP